MIRSLSSPAVRARGAAGRTRRAAVGQSSPTSSRARLSVVLAALLVLALGLLAGCVPGGASGGGAGGSGGSGDGWDAAPGEFDGTLRILAGSEVEDLEPLVADAESALGFDVDITYQGTLSGLERVAAGEADGRFDAIWFPSDRYLGLLDGGPAAVESSTRTMLSPIALGVKASAASRLGWDDAAPSWSDIAAAASAGEFSYGMTNPAQSNSGFSALIGVATAFSGTGSALTVDDITAVTPQMKDFFSGQELTAGSSGWLADRFAQDDSGVDGLINYESVLRSLPQAGGEDIITIIPSDGVVTADYPMAALSSGTAEAKQAAQALADWLIAPEQQERIVDSTQRRPIDAASALNDRFGEGLLLELPFPGSLDTARTLISTFLNAVSRPASTTYVLDVSGSMAGEGLEELTAAMHQLTAAGDGSSFTSFRNRETITLLPFSDQVHTSSSYQIPDDGDGAAERAQITAAVDALSAAGGTAIYDALLHAFDGTEQAQADNPDALHSIVLLSDGANTDGRGLQEFLTAHAQLSPELGQVPVFVILFGASDDEEMSTVAEATGGRAFDARSESLDEVFKEIRGYQ